MNGTKTELHREEHVECHLLHYISYMKSMGSDPRFPAGSKKETAVGAGAPHSKGAAVGTMTQSLKRS
jgi:hypothetical protein